MPVAKPSLARADDGEFEMDIDEDDEYAPSAEEIEAEETEEPLLMSNAGAWDDFLEYVGLVHQDWADKDPEMDTDLYRKEQAVRYFNAGATACPDPIVSLC